MIVKTYHHHQFLLPAIVWQWVRINYLHCPRSFVKSIAPLIPAIQLYIPANQLWMRSQKTPWRSTQLQKWFLRKGAEHLIFHQWQLSIGVHSTIYMYVHIFMRFNMYTLSLFGQAINPTLTIIARKMSLEITDIMKPLRPWKSQT